MTQEQENFLSYCSAEREKFIRRFNKKQRTGWDRVMAEDMVICMDNVINELRKEYNAKDKPANN